jgi:hypothetical protein
VPSYTIAYQQMQAPASPAFPKGRLIKRPFLVAKLRNQQNELNCFAIVDSGADHCVFPRSFMQPLGLDPLIAPVDMTSGLGSNSVPTHYSNVTLDLGIMNFQVYAGFTAGMDQHGIGLLGQQGFFDKFKISFDYTNAQFVLEIP